ncbi:unnamed protein product [Schistosoma haematobium]|nr:unnamed protein product [Schistosoma haematobium]CAH8610738.1 unnamed protein product [Schistosoma haematobium]CAH8610753.1 unnamed protein product [Schistosoma haematobium]
MKAGAVYVNLGHLWRLRDVSLAVNGRIYNVSVRAVFLYACETWPLQVEDVRRFFVFDHRCLRRITDIQWQYHVSSAEVQHRVSEYRDDNSIGVTTLKHRLRWLEHVLRISKNPLLCIIHQRLDRLEKAERWSMYDMVSWYEIKLYGTGFCWSFTTPWLES